MGSALADRPVEVSAGLTGFYRRTTGKKVVMAVSGVVGFGYVFAHMAGNLKIYLGAESLDHYSEWLRTLGQPVLPRSGLLWIMRSVLIVALVLHVHSAYSLTRLSRAAKPQKYAKREYLAANYASRTMRWGGVIVLLFVAYHLADLTWGAANPDFVRGAVYDNVVASFSRWPVALAYVIANIALGMHLFHGLWSMLQTLGISHERLDAWRRRFALGFATVVTAGNVSFPIAVLTGIVA